MQPYWKNYFQVKRKCLSNAYMNSFIISPLDSKWHIIIFPSLLVENGATNPSFLQSFATTYVSLHSLNQRWSLSLLSVLRHVSLGFPLWRLSSGVYVSAVLWQIRRKQAFSIPFGPLQAARLAPSQVLEPEILPLLSSFKWIWNGLCSVYALASIW